MIIWIGKALALAIHDRQLSEHGGIAGVRDEALLDSALARPQQLRSCGDPPPDLADLSASLALGIARNDPFADGNKRTALVCYRAFVALNGATVVASDEEKYVAMLSLAEGTFSDLDFAAWLRPRMRLEPKSQVREARVGYGR